MRGIMAEAETAAPQLQTAEAISKSLHDKLPYAYNDKSAYHDELADASASPRRDYHLYEGAQQLHMVMVPFPLQGHLNPMMQFAKALVANHPHIRITFINNKYNHDRIQQARSKSASHGHEEEENPRFLWVEEKYPSDFVLTDVLTRVDDFYASLENMKQPLKQLLGSLKQERPPVACAVFGSFCPWVNPMCVELGIPSIFFWTQSASVLSIYYHTPLLEAHGFFPYMKEAVLSGCKEDDADVSKEGTDNAVSYIPGVPALCPSSLPTLLHIDSVLEPSFASIRNQFAILRDCQGVIVNSFEELEEDAYQALQTELPVPVSFVGPLIPSAFLEDGNKNDISVGASLLEERSECMDWLNTQKPESVLYVSFGSLANPSTADIENIAHGLKASKQPFLWVLRPPSSTASVADILPEDFLDETKDIGLIIPWAPQVRVLSHPSVGAFLTHCGWNSTLESVSMGVPMIPFPFWSDQTTNSAYVCDAWKVGMAVKRQGDGKVRSTDLERVVRTVLGAESGAEMRERAHNLKEAARQAVRSSQGSSIIHMRRFIEECLSTAAYASPATVKYHQYPCLLKEVN